jgi:poly-gamma-glutamate capsule biosynthesis protein CapA/YwtB (metallophosphatase superfamily)
MREARSSLHITSIVIASLSLALIGCSDDAPVDQTATAPPPATAKPASSPTPPPVTTLLFTGDIIPARCTYARLQAIGDYGAPFDALRPQLSAADITIGTLDSTLADSAVPIGCTATFNLAGPAEFAVALVDAGFDVMSHAANHIKDCGNADCGDLAVTETIANLRANGVAPAGSGATLAEARTPAIIERSGVRFAFLAYDDIAPYYHATDAVAGAAPLDAATIGADIARARELADVVVVLPHWGAEYTASPSQRQREIARIAAYAGADLIIGNHAHWVAAHEQIGDTFVAYALGNFVFDQDWSVETQQGAMLEVTFTGTAPTKTRYIPIRIHDEHQPRLADPTEADAIIGLIESASAALVP